MKVKCSYCDSMIDDTLESCPNCGAPNEYMARAAKTTPGTIAELQKWYSDRNLPPYETTRFFIGEDYKGKRAFGIYEENGIFTVYKNKDDGSRAVRYSGTDEAYAVNEIYLKLKSEILNQKSKRQGEQSGRQGGGKQREEPRRGGIVGLALKAFFLLGLGLVAVEEYPVKAAVIAALPWAAYFIVKTFVKTEAGEKITRFIKKRYILYLIVALFAVGTVSMQSYTPHYYSWNDSVYCWYDDSYYLYDNTLGDYYYVDYNDVPQSIVTNGADYEFNADGMEWNSAYSFTDSQYFQDNLDGHFISSSGSSDWDYGDDDSDYDWDWDSDWDSGWDSGSSDWDSDW